VRMRLHKYSRMGLQTLGFPFISSHFPERAPAGQEVLLAYAAGHKIETSRIWHRSVEVS